MPMQPLRSLACVALLVSLHAPAALAEHAQHTVTIEQCWIRTLPSKLPAAGYLRIINHSAEALMLTGAHTKAYVHTMLHATKVTQGMHRMVHTDTVKVPANGYTDFSPGGYHLMLENAVQPMHVGDSITVIFTFDRVGDIPAKCTLRPPNAAADMPPHQPHSHSH